MAEELKKGELEKLLIKAYSSPDYSGEPAAEFKVYFNPEEYTQVYDVEFVRQQGEGTTGSPVVFRKIKPQEYKLKLMFDGTGVSGDKIDVYEKIQEFFKVAGYDGEIHRPRYLKLIWGKLESKCVLIKADVAYKIFKPDGTPLRAVMDATFTENVDDTTRTAEANDRSPNLTQVRVVKEGDTLPLMAYKIYGDESMYLEVARVNRLNNFRNLTTGQRIVFPPIEKDSNGK
jgi:hypothetical protein